MPCNYVAHFSITWNQSLHPKRINSTEGCSRIGVIVFYNPTSCEMNLKKLPLVKPEDILQVCHKPVTKENPGNPGAGGGGGEDCSVRTMSVLQHRESSGNRLQEGPSITLGVYAVPH